MSVSLQTRACIVIVTYNSAETIEPCLASLIRNITERDELWIIDNASTDETPNMLREFGKQFPLANVRLNKENVGFSRGCNQAIRESSAETVCLLNPDTVVPDNFLEKLLAHLNHPEIAAAGPVTDHAGTNQQIQLHLPELEGDHTVESVNALLEEKYDWRSLPTKLLTGFCCLWRRSALDQLGLLDEELFCGGDDLDLCLRARLLGYRLVVARNTFVHHQGQVSFATAGEKATKKYTQDANDHVAKKLLTLFGEGNVPTQEELWGIQWYETTVPVWSTENAESKVLGITWNSTLGQLQFQGAEGVTNLQQLPKSAFNQVNLHFALEQISHPGTLLQAAISACKTNGRINFRTVNPLSHRAWMGDKVQFLATPFMWKTLATQELDPGYLLFQAGETVYHLSEYGSQLHFNHQIGSDDLEQTPLTIEWEERSFVKVAGTSWKPGLQESQPKVTSMLAVYKRPALSTRVIDALLDQDMPQIELIITGDKCETHAERLQDPLFKAKLAAAKAFGLRVQTHNFGENHGSSCGAINYAIKHARAPYFMFTGDDDWIHPHHVANYLRFIEGTGHNVVFFDSRIVGAFYSNRRMARLEPGHVGHSELIVETEWARKMPEHTASTFHDWEFIANLANAGANFGRARGYEPTYWVNLARTETHYVQVA